MNCFVIAEAGVNHNGRLEMALELVDAAARAGADAVKFQTFRATEIATADAPKAAYQSERAPESQTQREMLSRLELSDEAHRTIARRCRDAGIAFMSSPFGVPDLELLLDVGVGAIKIGSGEITNLPLLRAAAGSGRPVYLSTGMSSFGEAADAVAVFGAAREGLTLLHCLSSYPAPVHEVNLRVMHAMSTTLRVPVGFSDHTLGTSIPIAAAALGAPVIEKHLTLDRELPGPDHAASLQPDEFQQMVSGIRDVQAALGDGVKRVMPSERENREIARKSIVARRRLGVGEVIAAESLTTKRPGSGVSPMCMDEFIGKRLTREVPADAMLAWTDIS